MTFNLRVLSQSHCECSFSDMLFLNCPRTYRRARYSEKELSIEVNSKNKTKNSKKLITHYLKDVSKCAVISAFLFCSKIKLKSRHFELICLKISPSYVRYHNFLH